MSEGNTAEDFSNSLDQARSFGNEKLSGANQLQSPSRFNVPKNGSSDGYANNPEDHVDRLAQARERDAQVENKDGEKKSGIREALDEVKNAQKAISKVATPTGFFGVLMQAKLFEDLPFVAAFGAAILKDLSDLAFIGSLPGIGTAITILCSIFIAMMMALSGGGAKRNKIKGIFKRIAVLLGGTLVEFLPGIDFFPVETITVLVIYVWTLMDRYAAEE